MNTQLWKTAIDFHMNPSCVRTYSPFAVLVFPLICGKLLWAKHPIRGWEVPGGKVEMGETPEKAAVRETFEETGAVLGSLEWVGEYGIAQLNGDIKYKWVYIGIVEDVHARPFHSEMLDVQAYQAISPKDVSNCLEISPIMKDTVYQSLWEQIQLRLTTMSV